MLSFLFEVLDRVLIAAGAPSVLMSGGAMQVPSSWQVLGAWQGPARV